jgi:FtsH-binding integral membrane protein
LPQIPSVLVYTLVGIITAAWVTSFIADLIVKEYNPPPELGAIFAAMAGAVFLGGKFNGRNGQGKPG